jgi:hypothetical protein
MSALVPLQLAETALIATRIASAVRMPLGIEQTPAAPATAVRREPRSFSSMTVREAFDTLVQLDPRYEWREVDDIAVFRPVAAWTDGRNILNRRVDNIAFDNVTVVQASDALLRVLFSRASPVPNAAGAGQTFSVHIASGSVLDLLNAVIKAHGALIWKVAPAEDDRPVVNVTLRNFEGGGAVRRWPVE